MCLAFLTRVSLVIHYRRGLAAIIQTRCFSYHRLRGGAGKVKLAAQQVRYRKGLLCTAANAQLAEQNLCAGRAGHAQPLMEPLLRTQPSPQQRLASSTELRCPGELHHSRC